MAQDAHLTYCPRPQFLPFHHRTQRWAVIVAHRRAGKTVATVNDLICRALLSTRPDGRYAFIAPYYNQAKDLAWRYLKEYAWPVLKEEPRESELSVLLANGARIRLYGGDNPNRLRGIYLDGVVLDEFGDMVPELWTSVLRPALADRGGWAVFIGTPKGRNQFVKAAYDKCKGYDATAVCMLFCGLQAHEHDGLVHCVKAASAWRWLECDAPQSPTVLTDMDSSNEATSLW